MTARHVKVDLSLTPAEFEIVYDALLALRDDYEYYEEHDAGLDSSTQSRAAVISKLCDRLHVIEQAVVYPH